MPPASLQHTHASMGPRSHERGNSISQAVVKEDDAKLQWGRVLMNAETGEQPTIRASSR